MVIWGKSQFFHSLLPPPTHRFAMRGEAAFAQSFLGVNVDVVVVVLPLVRVCTCTWVEPCARVEARAWLAALGSLRVLVHLLGEGVERLIFVSQLWEAWFPSNPTLGEGGGQQGPPEGRGTGTHYLPSSLTSWTDRTQSQASGPQIATQVICGSVNLQTGKEESG